MTAPTIFTSQGMTHTAYSVGPCVLKIESSRPVKGYLTSFVIEQWLMISSDRLHIRPPLEGVGKLDQNLTR